MTALYKTILYATDLTENAAHALRHAIGMAQVQGAELHVLHIMPEMDAAVVNYVASVIGEDRFADLELEHEAELKASLKARVEAFLTEQLGADKDLAPVKNIQVHHGNPVEEILKAVSRVNADLLVLGSHGKGAMHYMFLGSVAEKVLHRLEIPALVVHLPKG